MMDFLRRFMAGRYGNDQLNAALLVLGLVLIVVEMVTRWSWMGIFILALLAMHACALRTARRTATLNVRIADNGCACRAAGEKSISPARIAIRSLCARAESADLRRFSLISFRI